MGSGAAVDVVVDVVLVLELVVVTSTYWIGVEWGTVGVGCAWSASKAESASQPMQMAMAQIVPASMAFIGFSCLSGSGGLCLPTYQEGVKPLAFCR
jgi:hypothetical protein